MNEAVENDKQAIKNLAEKMDDIINPPEPGTVEYVLKQAKVSNENQDVVDIYENKITIPAGFTIVPNGTSNVEYTYTGDGIPAVQDGIVIQDSDGNQFVWVPVGTINNKEGDTRGKQVQ